MTGAPMPRCFASKKKAARESQVRKKSKKIRGTSCQTESVRTVPNQLIKGPRDGPP